MGAMTAIEKTLAGTRLTILASAVLGDLKVGDSVSINGTCLTVVTKGGNNVCGGRFPRDLVRDDSR